MYFCIKNLLNLTVVGLCISSALSPLLICWKAMAFTKNYTNVQSSHV